MPTKTIIKVCGLTRLDEALACSELGVQWLGFNCFRGSKRYLPPEAIATMIQKFPPEVKTVGVFVNSSATEIVKIL
ncbi:MAG: phosphoribosylanthranilate isomerase, partial [SAR324 cluster bacterium]|nr:phosphoribosylanthranilate isomerase [SAR324 cluster bacterium]